MLVTNLVVIHIHERVTPRLNLGEDATSGFERIRPCSTSGHDLTGNAGFVKMLQRLLRFLYHLVDGFLPIIRQSNVLIPALVTLRWDIYIFVLGF